MVVYCNGQVGAVKTELDLKDPQDKEYALKQTKREFLINATTLVMGVGLAALTVWRVYNPTTGEKPVSNDVLAFGYSAFVGTVTGGLIKCVGDWRTKDWDIDYFSKKSSPALTLEDLLPSPQPCTFLSHALELGKILRQNKWATLPLATDDRKKILGVYYSFFDDNDQQYEIAIYNDSGEGPLLGKNDLKSRKVSSLLNSETTLRQQGSVYAFNALQGNSYWNAGAQGAACNMNTANGNNPVGGAALTLKGQIITLFQALSRSEICYLNGLLSEFEREQGNVQGNRNIDLILEASQNAPMASKVFFTFKGDPNVQGDPNWKIYISVQ